MSEKKNLALRHEIKCATDFMSDTSTVVKCFEYLGGGEQLLIFFTTRLTLNTIIALLSQLQF